MLGLLPSGLMPTGHRASGLCFLRHLSPGAPTRLVLPCRSFLCALNHCSDSTCHPTLSLLTYWSRFLLNYKLPEGKDYTISLHLRQFLASWRFPGRVCYLSTAPGIGRAAHSSSLQDQSCGTGSRTPFSWRTSLTGRLGNTKSDF